MPDIASVKLGLYDRGSNGLFYSVIDARRSVFSDFGGCGTSDIGKIKTYNSLFLIPRGGLHLIVLKNQFGTSLSQSQINLPLRKLPLLFGSAGRD